MPVARTLTINLEGMPQKNGTILKIRPGWVLMSKVEIKAFVEDWAKKNKTP